MQQSNHDWHFRVAILGSAGTGKTCLMRALLGEAFSSAGYRATLGAERAVMEGIANGESVAVELTSLPGAYSRLPLTQLHLGAKPEAVIVTYAVNNVETFKETVFWVNEASRMSPGCLIVLVGTLVDTKVASVNGADALVQAKEWGGRAYTVSSKTGRGIDEFKKAFLLDIVREKGHVAAKTLD